MSGYARRPLSALGWRPGRDMDHIDCDHGVSLGYWPDVRGGVEPRGGNRVGRPTMSRQAAMLVRCLRVVVGHGCHVNWRITHG